jgi:hypothetical protein
MPKLFAPEHLSTGPDLVIWAFTELMMEEVAGEGWGCFMARLAAEAQPLGPEPG